jgi:predicted Zn-dependent peptidase
MMNRSKQPHTQQVEHIAFIKPQLFDVTQQVKLLWMKDVSNDTVRLDLFFDAGITRGAQSIPSIVHSLLFSGTATHSSVELHERIDALGGFLDTDISFENAVVSIYCLREHLMKIAQIVSEAINGLAFRENEVTDTLQSLKQQFLVNQQKVKNTAQQQFRKALFESNEDYSTIAVQSDFETPQVFQYKKFLQHYYLSGMTRMTLVGNVENDTVDALIDLFGKWAKDGKPTYASDFELTPKRIDFPKEDALQTAIRMGRFLFPKSHPDYIEFQV